jgi:hypothetical protein
MIVIDSDVLIEILYRKSQRGDDVLKQILASDEDICTTAKVYMKYYSVCINMVNPLRNCFLCMFWSTLKRMRFFQVNWNLKMKKLGNLFSEPIQWLRQ